MKTRIDDDSRDGREIFIKPTTRLFCSILVFAFMYFYELKHSNKEFV